MKEVQVLGVDFISHQEQIDTTRTQRDMVFGFIASLAQFELSLISGRVKAGMQRVRGEGNDVGRPPLPEDTHAIVQRLYTEEDVSNNKISERLDISYGTAWNYVQEIKNEWPLRCVGPLAPIFVCLLQNDQDAKRPASPTRRFPVLRGKPLAPARHNNKFTYSSPEAEVEAAAALLRGWALQLALRSLLCSELIFSGRPSPLTLSGNTPGKSS